MAHTTATLQVIIGVGILLGIGACGVPGALPADDTDPERGVARPSVALPSESAVRSYVVLLVSNEEASLLQALVDGAWAGLFEGRSVVVTTPAAIARALVPIEDAMAMGAAPYRLVDLRRSH